jgi:hypothetical protein
MIGSTIDSSPHVLLALCSTTSFTGEATIAAASCYTPGLRHKPAEGIEGSQDPVAAASSKRESSANTPLDVSSPWTKYELVETGSRFNLKEPVLRAGARDGPQSLREISETF